MLGARLGRCPCQTAGYSDTAIRGIAKEFFELRKLLHFPFQRPLSAEFGAENDSVTQNQHLNCTGV